jgi:outer membrane protein assembly factor BamA
MKLGLPATILAGLWAAASTQAQPAAPVIERIEVRDRDGREASPAVRNLVLARIRSRAGKPFDRNTVAEDLDRLRDVAGVGTGFRFDEATRVLTFRIEALRVLDKIVVVGNRHFDEAEILSRLSGITPGVRIEEGVIVERLRALQEEYRRRNFYFASVRYDSDELHGPRRRLLILISEGPRVRVRRVSFEGLREHDPDKIRAVVSTRSYFWPFQEGLLDDERLDGDERKLAEYLSGRGYLDVRVGRRLQWLNPEKTDVEVVFAVHEGVRYRINRPVRVLVTPAGGDPAVYTEAELLGRLRTPNLTFYSKAALDEDVKALQDAYGEVGRFVQFTRADGTRDRFGSEIEGRHRAPALADHREFIDVVFTVREAPRIEIGRIDVLNNRNVKSRVLLRVLRYYGLMPGEVLNSVSLRDAQRELESTRLFVPSPERPFALRIEPVPARDGAPGVRDLVVDVNETPQTGSISFGVGFSTNLGLLANVTYRDRNFDITDVPDHWEEILSNLIPGRSGEGGRPFTGAGEEFRLELQPGLEFSTGRLAWRTPYFGDRGFNAGADIFGEQRPPNRDYSDFRAGVQLSVGRRLSENWGVEAALRPELILNTIRKDDPNVLPNPAPAPPPNGDDRSRDVLRSEGSFFETRLILSAVMDNRKREGDRVAAYTSGDFFSISLIPAVGTRQYLDTSIHYKRLWTVRTDIDGGKDVFSVGGRFGYIFGDVPVFDRYYAGGTGTIRGFQFRGITPRAGPRHDAIGGKMLIVGSAEYSIPIVHTEDVVFRAFVFVDGGTVERRAEITKFRLSAGPGLRLAIPQLTGPALFELGFGVPFLKDRRDATQLVFITAGFQF